MPTTIKIRCSRARQNRRATSFFGVCGGHGGWQGDLMHTVSYDARALSVSMARLPREVVHEMASYHGRSQTNVTRTATDRYIDADLR